MTQRKVLVRPSNRFDRETKTFVPFTGAEAEFILSYLRDPVAFNKNKEQITKTVSLKTLLDHPYANQTFGRKRCGYHLPATISDIRTALKATERTVEVKNLIHSLVNEHYGIDIHYELTLTDDAVTIQYPKDCDILADLASQIVVRNEYEELVFKDNEVVSYGQLMSGCDIGSEPRQQYRELFINAIPNSWFKRSPIDRMLEFTPAVRYELLQELALNPTLVKEIYLTAFRDLALSLNDLSFRFSGLLWSLERTYNFGRDCHGDSFNWDCVEHVEQLTELLINVLMFDELQERNRSLTYDRWRWPRTFNDVVARLSDDDRAFYNLYSCGDLRCDINNVTKFRSPEEANEASLRYEQILNELENTKFVVHYL